jgi:hypothetical protein
MSSAVPARTFANVIDEPILRLMTSEKPDAATSSDALQAASVAASASYLPVSATGAPPPMPSDVLAARFF